VIAKATLTYLDWLRLPLLIVIGVSESDKQSSAYAAYSYVAWHV